VAKRIGISAQAYWALEQREIEQRASMGDLGRAAEAMGCELIYYIRPKSRVPFARNIWNKIYARAKDHPHVLTAMQYETTWAATALARQAIRLFKDRKFRKEMGWSYLKTNRHNHIYRKTKPKRDPWVFRPQRAARSLRD
jgi:transcriptional regulator with XRE-family HTH domain